MPAGGRISRRDNLRGKVFSNKLEPNVKVPGLKLLSMMKDKNADKKLQLKKDIMIEEKETDNSSERLKRKNSRLHNKLEKPLDRKSCRNKNETIEVTKEKKKSDNLVKIGSDISPNRVSIINTTTTIDIDLVESKLRKESAEKIHSNIEEGIKRRNAKKKNTNEKQCLDLNSSKLCASKLKSKISKKDDLIEQIEIVQEDKISNNELQTPKQKGRKTRLLLKENVSLIDEMIKEDELMVKIEVPVLCIEDIKTSKLRGKKHRLLVEKDEEDRVKEVLEMEIDNEINITKELEDKKEVQVKKAGRPLSKMKDKIVPFVVEQVVSEKSKIPGLAFLQYLKDRKSIISTNPSNTEVSKSKIPGLSNTAEIRRRKSQFVSETATSSNNTLISSPEVKYDNKSPKCGSEIIPGLSSTAEIKRRKSVLEVTNQQCTLTASETKASEIYTETNQVLSSLLNKRQRKSIFDVSDEVNTKQSENLSKDIKVTSVPNKRLSSYKVKTVLESPKVPGFSLIEEIRSRKSAIPSQKNNSNNSVYDSVKELLSTPLTTETCLSVPPVFSQSSSVTLSSTVKPSLYLTDAPSNIFSSSQSLSRHPLSSTTSCLSSLYKSSPSILKTPISSIGNTNSQSINSLVQSNKRPMSCLSNDNEDFERREKIARTLDVEESSISSSRRQSVTFNNRVEVKEIKGNSFSSDSGDIEQEVTDEAKKELMELERKVKENMEKTKLRLVNKRLGESAGNIFSFGPKCQTNISTSTPTSSFKFSGISHNSSGLSDYMIARKKAQLNLSGVAAAAASNTSSMYNFNNRDIKWSNSGPQSTITSTVSSHYGGSKALSKEAEPMEVDDMSNEISDDEMDEEERNKKDKCTIL